MILFRTLTCTALLLTITTLPSAAETGDTRARVDLSQSHTVVYPKGFETSNEQGTVTLAVGVGADGLVTHLRVAQTSGYHDLDIAATESAMNWRYTPATHDGDTHPDEIMLKVEYDRPDPATAAPNPAH
jgi:TonB family protein